MPEVKQTTPTAIDLNPQNTPSVRSPHFRVVPFSNLKISSSPLEVRLTICHIADAVGINTGFVNEEEVCIVMPPALVRNTLEFIEKYLQNYEKTWGPIPPVPKKLSQVGNATES
jgi:hypothetical protein